jgi:hypothetical protein
VVPRWQRNGLWLEEVCKTLSTYGPFLDHLQFVTCSFWLHAFSEGLSFLYIVGILTIFAILCRGFLKGNIGLDPIPIVIERAHYDKMAWVSVLFVFGFEAWDLAIPGELRGCSARWIGSISRGIVLLGRGCFVVRSQS